MKTPPNFKVLFDFMAAMEELDDDCILKAEHPGTYDVRTLAIKNTTTVTTCSIWMDTTNFSAAIYNPGSMEGSILYTGDMNAFSTTVYNALINGHVD